MNEIEAEKIIKIMCLAGGSCEICTGELLNIFVEKFPEFEELAERIFLNKFDQNLKNISQRGGRNYES